MSVLPWRSLPRRRGFWGRQLRAAHATESLGLHPAFHPHISVDEAAPRAVSSPSPLSERVPAYPPLKPKAASSRSDETLWCLANARTDIPINSGAPFKGRPLKASSLKSDTLKTDALKTPFLKGQRLEVWPLEPFQLKRFLMKRFLLKPFQVETVSIGTFSTDSNLLPADPFKSRSNFTSVNQEGGLCNTPLYNY